MRETWICFCLILSAALIGCADDLPDLSAYNFTEQSQQDSPPPQPPPPPPPRYTIPFSQLHWSLSGPLAGKYCVQWSEPADPHTWDDNYLCTDNDYGFTWKYGLPLDPKLICVLIDEPDDPDTWNDNFLCMPKDYGIVWSHDGEVPGLRCLKITEGAEPFAHSWNDNYLCL